MADRVTIVGRGIVGLSCAYFLNEAGFEVEVIDRAPEDKQNCSFGNAGMIVPSHFIPLAAPGMVGLGMRMMLNPRSPFWIRPRLNVDLMKWIYWFMRSANAKHVAATESTLRDFSLMSRSIYLDWADQFHDAFHLKQEGLLMLCKTQETLDEEKHIAQRAVEIGLKAKVYDLAGLSKVDPDITMEVAGGVHFEDDCHLDPNALMAQLQVTLLTKGVRFRWGCQVTGVDVADGKVRAIQTTAGLIESDQFVLAGGAETGNLAALFGLSMPLVGGKGYSFMVDSPPQLPRVCSILTEARVAVTPKGAGVRFSGTMEIGASDESVNPLRVEGIVRSIPSFFPAFKESDLSGKEIWAGLRPCSADGMPYIGPLRHHPNVWVASGHGMMGLSLGPATGMLLKQMMRKDPISLNLKQFDPNRFDGR